VEHNYSSEAVNRSAGHDITQLLWNPNFYYMATKTRNWTLH